MREITRMDVNEDWAHSGVVEAGDFVFVNYCAGNPGMPVEDQINGSLDRLRDRLKLVNLTLESVVRIDAMFKNIFDIPVMQKVDLSGN